MPPFEMLLVEGLVGETSTEIEVEIELLRMQSP